MKSRFYALMIVLSVFAAALGDIMDFTTIDIDLTDPASGELCDWIPADTLTINEHGLGFDDSSPDLDRMDVSIVTHPVPVGYFWRPPTSVRITAEFLPPIQIVDTKDGKRPSRQRESLFARHSPDLKHWSDWAVVPRNQETNSVFEGGISLPHSEEWKLRKINTAFREAEPEAWADDQEAAIKWWVERNPDYFDSNKPFIGYVQLMYEGRIEKGVRLKKLSAKLAWWIGGLHSEPPDQETKETMLDIPWRYTAPPFAHADENEQDRRLRSLIEEKYNSQLELFKVIDFSPTTKVLWFDWEKEWWGAMNVVETAPDGSVRFCYDIPDPPTAQSIKRIRVVKLSGRKYVEVIDRTHMGNGMLYLYEIRDGIVRLAIKTRVIANTSVHFEPPIANVTYQDLDSDGDDDILIEGQIVDRTDKQAGNYRREFLFETGSFRENIERRLGAAELMD